MKRIITAAAGLAAVALALTGCAGQEAPAEEEGPVTLSVAVWSLDQTPEFQALFDAFEAANPDITIQPVDILADDYPEKVTTMLAGGDTTDVITMKTVVDYLKYAQRGQLADVTDTVEGLDTDAIAGLDPYEVDGAYYASPYRQDFWLLYYNKGLFDAAGLPYPDHITWDDYVDLSKQLTDDSVSPKVYGSYQHVWRSVEQAIAAAQTDGDLLSGDYGFMEDQYALTLDLQQSGASLDYATAKTQQVSYRTMFETGQTAMMHMGTWYISGIKAAIDAGNSTVDWGVAPIPQVKAGGETKTFGSPTAFAVNAKSKHQEAAKKFLAFASSEEGALAIAKIGVVPAFSSDAVTAAFTALPTDDLSVETFSEPKQVALEMPVSDDTSDISTILDEEHDLIMVGEHSVADGIAAMEERVKNEVLGG
ncbi:ABC transporter substrate-binding protein [Agromyces sp. MMS24-K17]|uniref:ABC transporter substrate-binding protein n=1 Tax=Agromyces sp. MMS24-K17 TaxID=3372850 RepID=UPI0037541B1A